MSQLEHVIKSFISEEIAAMEKRLYEKMQMAPDRDFTFAEACEYLGMSEYTLRKLVQAKAIPHRTYGVPGSKNPRYIFSQNGLNRWKKEQEDGNWIRHDLRREG